MKREGISTLSIRGFPRALRYFTHFLKFLVYACFEKFYFMITLYRSQECDEVVLNFFLKCVSVKSFDLSKYLLTSTYSKKVSSFSFRQCYPIIKE